MLPASKSCFYSTLRRTGRWYGCHALQRWSYVLLLRRYWAASAGLGVVLRRSVVLVAAFTSVDGNIKNVIGVKCLRMMRIGFGSLQVTTERSIYLKSREKLQVCKSARRNNKEMWVCLSQKTENHELNNAQVQLQHNGMGDDFWMSIKSYYVKLKHNTFYPNATSTFLYNFVWSKKNEPVIVAVILV